MGEGKAERSEHRTFRWRIDRLGPTVTSHAVSLRKNQQVFEAVAAGLGADYVSSNIVDVKELLR